MQFAFHVFVSSALDWPASLYKSPSAPVRGPRSAPATRRSPWEQQCSIRCSWSPPSQSRGGDRSGIGACGGRLEDNHDRKEGVAKCTRALRAWFSASRKRPQTWCITSYASLQHSFTPATVSLSGGTSKTYKSRGGGWSGTSCVLSNTTSRNKSENLVTSLGPMENALQNLLNLVMRRTALREERSVATRSQQWVGTKMICKDGAVSVCNSIF